MEQYNLTYTGAELDSAIGRASEGFAKADEVTQEMEQLIAEVETKLNNGDFVGPQGVSGVYVGSGEMPEGYNVQIDPNGSGSCYMAGESDARYANAITGEATGKVANLTDAWAGGVLSKCEISGQEAGVTPSKLSASGKNLLDSALLSGTDLITLILQNDGTLVLNKSDDSKGATIHHPTTPIYLPAGEYILSLNTISGTYNSSENYINFGMRKTDGVSAGYAQITNSVASRSFRFVSTGIYYYFYMYGKYTCTDWRISIQLEPGTAATAYEPYAGTEYPLPELAPLYSLNDVCDIYDATTGVETRRIGKDEDGSLYELESPVVTQHDPIAVTVPAASANIFADAGEVSVTYTKDTNKVIAALTERIAALEGGNQV